MNAPNIPNTPPPSAIRLDPLSRDDPDRLGDYRLIGRLASGGMGRVYLGRSTADGSLAAVKTLLARDGIGEVERRRFAREVGLAQRVRGEHTARVLAADPEAARPWMAIRYIPAPSLAELVASRGVADEACVRRLGASCAAVLLELHEGGIVHRDLKPQNILLPTAGLRLIDFGISHAVDVTRTHLTLGTIAFTSPEQARGEPSTAASDVYSLGATLFHLAVGRPPYPETGNDLRLLALVARARIDTTDLPGGLRELILPCLALDPNDRPRTADLLGVFTEPGRSPSLLNAADLRIPDGWRVLIDAYEHEGLRLVSADPPFAHPTIVTAPPEPTSPAQPAATRVDHSAPEPAPQGRSGDRPADWPGSRQGRRPSEPADTPRRFAGLSATGWRAAARAGTALTVLVVYALLLFAVLAVVVVIVVAVARE
ncbi:serine/threonine-protein kinase [Embleya sp. NPDC008237]|uniref:serine/threonine-protein kinase n=1 Tax=Embleya sp. NPDC008237 TaxID=3363978 RepID=UPI0036ED14B1